MMVLKPTRAQALEVVKTRLQIKRRQEVEQMKLELPPLKKKKDDDMTALHEVINSQLRDQIRKDLALLQKVDSAMASLGFQDIRQSVHNVDIWSVIKNHNDLDHAYTFTVLLLGQKNGIRFTVYCPAKVKLSARQAKIIHKMVEKSNKSTAALDEMNKKISLHERSPFDDVEEMAWYLPPEAEQHVDILREMLQKAIEGSPEK